MRKILWIAAALAVLTLAGCKTSEKNYREAYERTLARDSTRNDITETIYGKHRREVREVPVFTENDTITARMMKVRVTKDGGGINENLKKYCVVVGEFKQIFNARSMRERLVEAGVPGAFVVENEEPYYYVLAGSSSLLPDATMLLEKMQHNPPFRLPIKPYLLTPIGM